MPKIQDKMLPNYKPLPTKHHSANHLQHKDGKRNHIVSKGQSIIFRSAIFYQAICPSLFLAIKENTMELEREKIQAINIISI